VSLLTVKQAARYAGIDPWIIVAAIDNKKLQGIPLQGSAAQLRTTKVWLEEWMQRK
jgi:hypothetical protein